MGAEFQVNSYTTNGQTKPEVAVGIGGDFVVAWRSDDSSGTDDGSDSIQARIFRRLHTDCIPGSAD